MMVDKDSEPTVGCFNAFLAVSCAVPIAIVTGTTLGQSAHLLPELMEPGSHIQITREEATWIASILVLGELMSSLICGYLADVFGRLRMFQLCTLFNALGYALVAASSNFLTLVTGRFFMGVAIGAYSAGTVFVSETSPPEFRGLFLSMSSTCIAVGLGLMSFIGVYLPWNIASTIMCSFAMLAFILTFLYHEPASWLVQMGRLDEAEQSLKRVELPENVNARLKEIQEAKAEREKEGGGLKIGFDVILEPTVWKPFLMMTAISALQGGSGYYTVVFYTINFIEEFQIPFDSAQVMMAFGVARVLSSASSTLLLRRMGRKTIGAISGFASALVLSVVCGYLQLRSNNPVLAEEYSWVPACSLILFVLTTGLGIYPLPWIMPNEVFPLNVRGVMCGICFALMTFYTYIPVKLYNVMIDELGLEGSLLLFAASCALFGFVSVVFLVETHKKSLDEIERGFSKG